MERNIFRCDSCKSDFEQDRDSGYKLECKKINESVVRLSGHLCPMCFVKLAEKWHGYKGADADGAGDGSGG